MAPRTAPPPSPSPPAPARSTSTPMWSSSSVPPGTAATRPGPSPLGRSLPRTLQLHVRHAELGQRVPEGRLVLAEPSLQGLDDGRHAVDGHLRLRERRRLAGQVEGSGLEGPQAGMGAAAG